jgi:hypothetical protein
VIGKTPSPPLPCLSTRWRRSVLSGSVASRSRRLRHIAQPAPSATGRRAAGDGGDQGAEFIPGRGEGAAETQRRPRKKKVRCQHGTLISATPATSLARPSAMRLASVLRAAASTSSTATVRRCTASGSFRRTSRRRTSSSTRLRTAKATGDFACPRFAVGERVIISEHSSASAHLGDSFASPRSSRDPAPVCW